MKTKPHKSLSRREFLQVGAAFTVGLYLLDQSASAEEAGKRMEEHLLDTLQAGNQRFASEHARHPHTDHARVEATGKDGQHPDAIVLCCADSRVSPELIFDMGIGDLFTIRVAGNVVNEDEIASVEYAVKHLHVPVCIVLGHTHCGAVKAVVEKEELTPELEHLVKHIGESAEIVTKRAPHLHGPELVEAIVEENVQESIRDLLSASMLRDAVNAGSLRIVGAIYDIETGEVRWL